MGSRMEDGETGIVMEYAIYQCGTQNDPWSIISK